MIVQDLIEELEKQNPNAQVMIAVIPNKAYRIGNVVNVKQKVYLTEGDYREWIPKATVKKLGWEDKIHPEILDGLSD